MKKLLFKLARSKLGGGIVGLAFERFSYLIPVARIAENEKAMAFYHPRPSYKTHILIVPKKSIKDINAAKEEAEVYIEACLELKEQVLQKLPPGPYEFITNTGARQDVPQLHYHLFTKEKL